MDDRKGEEGKNSKKKKRNPINSNEVKDMTILNNITGGISERKYVELTSEEIHTLNGILAGMDAFDVSVDGLGIELVGNTFYIHLIGVNRV